MAQEMRQRKRLFIYVCCILLLSGLNSHSSAEELDLDRSLSLTVSSPEGWQKKVIQRKKERTEIAWRRPGSQETGLMLVKVAQFDPSLQYRNTESYAKSLMYVFFSKGEQGIQEPEKVRIAGLNWMKIRTETISRRRSVFRADTYCLIEDTLELQVRVMGDKKYWDEVVKETEKSLRSLRISLE